MSGPVNPYAEPSKVVDDVGKSLEFSGQAEALRRDHLTYEVTLKIMGGLCFLFAFHRAFTMASAISLLISKYGVDLGGDSYVLWSFLVVEFVIIVAGFCILGRGLVTLRPWVRVAGLLICLLGLLDPIGTGICAYILWLLYSDRSRFVLSKEYAAIVAVTPLIKYPLSLWIVRTVVTLVLAFTGSILLQALIR